MPHSFLYLSILITTNYLNFVRSDSNNTTKVTVTTETTTTHIPLTFWSLDYHCKFQPDSHRCSKHNKYGNKWYYDIKMEDCKPFKHFRCKTNNKNIFRSYTECREFCRDSGPRGIEDVLPENAACHLQPDFGDCQDYIPMFYFDISTRRCLGFSYSGCGGNQNRFYDDKSCAAVCVDAVELQ